MHPRTTHQAGLGVSGPPATLGARIARRDEAGFVGRTAELRLVERLLANDPPANVLLVHGRPGVGKSAFLREIERRGRRLGRPVTRIDGADVERAAAGLEGSFAGARTAERPLVLVDGYERLTAAAYRLRSELLVSLPARSLVVIASRRPPERAWSEGGWETVAIQLELHPLSPGDARALLARRGLGADPRVGAILRSAAGPPLVREALRNLGVPHALAQSPLASGQGVAERAASVRALIAEAAGHAFGDTHGERLLAEVLVRGYLEPAGGHEQAAAELHMSRSAYFRRLRTASERIASCLALGRT
jgi:hypothetical protein